MTAFLNFTGDLLSKLLDINITATVVILLVIAARLLLKRAPKIFSYALWAIVLLRLLVPVSIQSPVAVVPEQKVFSAASGQTYEPVAPKPQVPQLQAPEDEPVTVMPAVPETKPETKQEISVSLEGWFSLAWMLGIGVIAAISLVSYGKLRKKVRISVPLQKGIRVADDIRSPFVMGFIRPVIYLPATLQPSEQRYIIAHEQHHIRRGDHIFKLLGFLALMIHWFNPLVWIAFVLAAKDMEMSCDEAVIRRLGPDVRADYSQSLLSLATGHRVFTGTPLAFGEGDPAGRVRNLARWKKPAIWVSVFCVVLCVVLGICLLTNRGEAEEIPSKPTEVEPTFQEPESWEGPTLGPEFDWGLSFLPGNVSPKSVTLVTRYAGSNAKEVLTYGEDFSLERQSNDSWVAVEELESYTPQGSDATFTVVDNCAVLFPIVDRYGYLPDGRYRVGKMITRNDADGSSAQLMHYFTFSLEGGYVPLRELPDFYTAEDAAIDGCYVQKNGIAADNIQVFRRFANDAADGQACKVRIYNWGLDPSAKTVYDLRYDGKKYILESSAISQEYQYLKMLTGEKAWENADHDAFTYYVLTNRKDLTLADLNGLKPGERQEDREEILLYAGFTVNPKKLQLPGSLQKAELIFDGKVSATVTDPAQLEAICSLFENGEFIGYEPKTHSIGIGLDLILYYANGDKLTIELDCDKDICRIGGEYLFYGAYDEPSYVDKLWHCLGIDCWPEHLYEKHHNAHKH